MALRFPSRGLPPAPPDLLRGIAERASPHPRAYGIPLRSSPQRMRSYAHMQPPVKQVVRGAPAIGVTAALAMAVELHARQTSGKPLTSADDVAAFVTSALAHLVTSRPTAVNLVRTSAAYDTRRVG